MLGKDKIGMPASTGNRGPAVSSTLQRAASADGEEYPDNMTGGGGSGPRRFPTRQGRATSGQRSFRERAGTVLEMVKRKTMTLELPILPCWDEGDDGIPGICRTETPSWWMVFNPKNRLTNDNLFCIAFGNVGFKYFDRNRSSWMGLAMWSTLFSIAFTIAGCFALSTNMTIVQNTHWFKFFVTNTTSHEEFIVEVGLRSFVYTHNPCTPFGCERENFVFSETQAGMWPNEFVGNGMTSCRDNANEAALGALMTCATLFFALSGTVSRMRFSSDANIQKALGMLTDLFCACVPQGITLYKVGRDCYWRSNLNYRNEIEATVKFGPGYYCYIICLYAAILRALFHWLTPIPNHGSGCKIELPASLVAQLDTDGDGKVSWQEMKLAYKILLKSQMEARMQSLQAKESDWKAAATNGAFMVKMQIEREEETTFQIAAAKRKSKFVRGQESGGSGLANFPSKVPSTTRAPSDVRLSPGPAPPPLTQIQVVREQPASKQGPTEGQVNHLADLDAPRKYSLFTGPEVLQARPNFLESTVESTEV